MKMHIHHHHHLDPALERLLDHGVNALTTIITNQETIMSKISENTEAIRGFVEQVKTRLSNISADIGRLKETIDKLQNSPPVLTVEDQALLDTAQALVASLVTQAAETDELTPPVPPAG